MKICPSCGTSNFNMAEKCMQCNTSLVNIKRLSEQEEERLAEEKKAHVVTKPMDPVKRAAPINKKNKKIKLGFNNGSLWAQILMFVNFVSYLLLLSGIIYYSLEFKSFLIFLLGFAGLVLYIALTMVLLEMFNNINRIKHNSRKTNELLERILQKDN